MIRFIFICTFALLSLSAWSQDLKLSFTTSNVANGKYNPKHIVAVWVCDANNKYVKTLLVYAEERKKYLEKWTGSSGGDRTDAVSGATLNAHRSHSVTWNMKNFANQTVQNGNYKLCMEITSNDAKGPYREIPFSLNGNDFVLNPETANNFSNVQLTYENGAVSSSTQKSNETIVSPYPKIFDNNLTVDVNLVQPSTVEFRIYNANNQLAVQHKHSLPEGKSSVKLDPFIHNLVPGVYILTTEAKNYIISHKIIKR
jgi:hypothetical protein